MNMKKNHKPNHSDHFNKKVGFLDSLKRRKEFPPEQQLKLLPINQNDTILDIGAGTGFLTIPAAKLTDGMVYALDIDSNMLQMVDSKATNDGLENVRTIQGEMKDIPLSPNSIDIVLASLVLHEIKPLSETLQLINQVLKVKGHFACIELEEEKEPNHNHPRISASKMELALNKAGFAVMKKFYPTDSIYVLIAQKQS